MILKDGLYRICNSFYCAGFVVRNGFICEEASILKKKLNCVSKKWLMSVAEWICE